MQMKFTFLGLLLVLTVPIIAQQPVPCTNGTQNTCQCSTSPIICTIDDLDGYQYDMTTYLHPSHGPQPMCPPPEGNNTASHNPTWFRFPAWCTDLELEVCYNNCVDGPACFGGGDFGIQYRRQISPEAGIYRVDRTASAAQLLADALIDLPV